MTAGWFDAWRDDGGPALHADPNRTHVTVDTPELFICIAFATLFIAFLIIVPGKLDVVGDTYYKMMLYRLIKMQGLQTT